MTLRKYIINAIRRAFEQNEVLYIKGARLYRNHSPEDGEVFFAPEVFLRHRMGLAATDAERADLLQMLRTLAEHGGLGRERARHYTETCNRAGFLKPFLDDFAVLFKERLDPDTLQNTLAEAVEMLICEISEAEDDDDEGEDATIVYTEMDRGVVIDPDTLEVESDLRDASQITLVTAEEVRDAMEDSEEGPYDAWRNSYETAEQLAAKFWRSVSFYDHPRERVMRDGKDIQASHPRHLLL